MTVFTQAILKGALAPRHLVAGLWIDESDHDLILKHGTEEIAHWGIYGNLWGIRAKADAWLEQNHQVDNR